MGTGKNRIEEVVKAVIYKDQKYLLQLRDDNPAISSPNTWGFFGGGVDDGETHEEALIRELNEELNWKPKKIELFHIENSLKTKYYSIYFNTSIKQLCLCEGQEMKWYYSEEIFELSNTPSIVKKIMKMHKVFMKNDKLWNND